MTYLFVFHIPIVKSHGLFCMPKLAAMDLLAHRRLLPPSVRLVVAAPLVENLAEPLLPLEGMEVAPLRYENGFIEGLLVSPLNWSALYREIRACDFVHTGCGGFPFFFSPCFQAHLITLLKGKPCLFVMDCDLVGKLEEDQISHAGNPFKKMVWMAYAKLAFGLFRFCLKTAGASFLLGQGVARRYGPCANNSLEIYQPIAGQENIIHQDQFLAKLSHIRSGQSLKAVFAGRLAHEKGVDVFLNALGILKKKGITLEADILGDGPERTTLEKLAAKLEINVNFHGALEWGEAIFAKLRESHIFMIMHRTEEMTRTPFEGMASGCALVCSDTEAMLRLLKDSGGGMAFRKGDASALADILSNLLKNRVALAGLVESGLKFFKKNHRDAHIGRRLAFLADSFSDLPWRLK